MPCLYSPPSLSSLVYILSFLFPLCKKFYIDFTKTLYKTIYITLFRASSPEVESLINEQNRSPQRENVSTSEEWKTWIYVIQNGPCGKDRQHKFVILSFFFPPPPFDLCSKHVRSIFIRRQCAINVWHTLFYAKEICYACFEIGWNERINTIPSWYMRIKALNLPLFSFLMENDKFNEL